MDTCPNFDGDYIDPEHADHLRVVEDWHRYDEGGPVLTSYSIDAACEHGHHIAPIWTHDNLTGKPIATVARAVELAQMFAADEVPHLFGTRPKVPARLLRNA